MTQASQAIRFERWRAANCAVMVIGIIGAFIISSNLPPNTPVFIATSFIVVGLMVAAAPLGARSIAHDNNIPLRERYALGTMIMLAFVLFSSLAGQCFALLLVLHHM